ncbi:ABC transporter A family member 7-like isoform X2 [Elaeis guineensis]|uniref:ABC transporter A family member 7 isoform X2 n=1 Tax=Elaeis guineensis var. tenera TaxID=51953 RepID=A0A6I9QTN0_ELAGV|nr:ABC transporter A family member 7 isoform X2 [Elaeis guineensis]
MEGTSRVPARFVAEAGPDALLSMRKSMESSRGPASFFTQADALLRKNLVFQKRKSCTNICTILFPVLICLLVGSLQTWVNILLVKYGPKCQCYCVEAKNGTCKKEACLDNMMPDQLSPCPVPSPPKWPPLLQVPEPKYRATRDDIIPFTDLPDKSCKRTKSCPATILVTGGNQSFAKSLTDNFFMKNSSSNISDYLGTFLSNLILGTDSQPMQTQFTEAAFLPFGSLYVVQPKCASNSTHLVSFQVAGSPLEKEVECVQGLPLWRSNSSAINDELFRGYEKGNAEKNSNEILAAYDFLNSDEKILNVSIWYNSTYKTLEDNGEPTVLRVPRSINVASSAYLRVLRGGANMQFEYVKEMPKLGMRIMIDLSSLTGTLFYVWVMELLFPIILTYLVYEKQWKLRIMMKMHGLGNGPYWTISYAYFLLLSSVYTLCFVMLGSITDLKIFQLNDYSIQFVFYFIYINLQIALAFFVAAFFSDVKTATVVGYIYVFGSGLLGEYLFQYFIEDTSFSGGWILVMEMIPALSLYRGIYEFSNYALQASQVGTSGMQWRDLGDRQNGIKDVLVIMVVEWLLLLPVACYLDQVVSLGDGVGKSTLFFLPCFRKKPSLPFCKPILQQQKSEVLVEIEKPDLYQERQVVEQLLREPSTSHVIICDNLQKVYPGRDGNPEKLAVRELSLALPRGECFGILGPNGAGKTSLIHMMIGFIKPTSGTAYIHGMDIRTDMEKIYTGMGVCPQHDLLWETLTGREHLMFYGRLKNLKGAALSQAVEESLKSVNLFHGGVGDKPAGKYSGGMKRRLSIAISLIGDPKVVYMDEPSSGLDPASRKILWDVVKRAKQDRAIILTTHSMEEAEALCDRLGIVVDGSLQCIGNAKELKARFGGSRVLTIMTSPSEEEEEIEHLVLRLSPRANKIYHLSGTHKFELPKEDVRIADIFQLVKEAQRKFPVDAWELVDTTLEDVFIKVAKGEQAFNELS